MAETTDKVRSPLGDASADRRCSTPSYAWVPPTTAGLLLVLVVLTLFLRLDGVLHVGHGSAEAASIGAVAPGGGGEGGSENHGSADNGSVVGSAAGDVASGLPSEAAGGLDDGPDAESASPGAAQDSSGGAAVRLATDRDVAEAGSSTRDGSDVSPPPDRLGFQSDLLAPPPAVKPQPAGDLSVSTPGSATPGLASFFGQTGRGSRFVYIIDRSGSMDGDGFDAARFELIKSIRGLGEHERFYVIFYDSKAKPMPATGLVVASEKNRQRYIEWVRSVSVGGGTDPTQALTLALTKLKPDTIWLLSDGSFSAGVTATIQRLNPRAKVQINTIAFHHRGGETLLRIIADENDGDYRYVGP